MPAYLIEHDNFKKPFAVEIGNPRDARAHVAKGFTVRRLSARECFDMSEQGVELQVPSKAESS